MFYGKRKGYLWTVARYCDARCAGLARRTIEIRKCLSCGSNFNFMPSQLNKYKGAGKFCSKICHGDWKAKQWKDKPITDKYGRTKRREDHVWQKAIRDRDKCTCQRCGTYEKYIHTHHVATRARRPDLKHDVNNGVCLCGRCHGWVHTHPKEAAEVGLLSLEKYELTHQVI